LTILALSIILLGLTISVIGGVLYFAIKKAESIPARCWDTRCEK
jgi:hypothetical protein